MFGQKFFPYSTLQELNLDWILTKVKNILRFVPDDGAVGQILRRTRDGAEWSDEQGGGGAVDSVNGQTGTVVLTASDVGALPDTYTAPVTSVNTKTGAVVLDKTDIGLGNVANVAQYSASNPPPYPVTSVNTKTGAVVLDKSDVGLGNVANVAQYSASNPPPYPVTSVNGQTGAVTVPYDDGQYHIGDTIDFGSNYGVAYGYAANTTTVRCTLPLSKDIGSDITGFNTTCNVAWARGSNAHNISTPTIATRMVTVPNQLFFEITVSGVTVFEVFMIAFGGGTVTFT